MSNPSVSVVVPVYNSAEFVAESIESMLCQTWSDFELIAVDDGSTDNSAEILRRYADCDERVKVISRPNTGIVGALNDGIAASCGEFIAIMHADDISFPERLACQMDYLRQHQDCVAVGSAILRVDSDGSPMYAEPWACDPTLLHENLLLGRGSLAHPTAMIRAESLRRVGGYRREYELAEDADLWLRLDEIGALGNVPDVLLAYRRHAKTLSCQNENKMRRAHVAAIQDAYQRRGLPGQIQLPLKTKRGDPVQREITQWIRGATANGSFDVASQYMRRLMVEYPTHVRTWRAFVQYGFRLANHRIKLHLLSQSEVEKTTFFNRALQQYRDAKEAMALYSETRLAKTRADSQPLSHRRVA